MDSIKTLSLTPNGNAWLTDSYHPRILHVFGRACNLINERREVLSVVTQEIGNGPFNLVVEEDVLFSDHLNLESPISISPNLLNLGDLTIHTDNARLWSPRPDWETLHATREDLLNRLTKLPITNYQVRGLDTPFTKTVQGYSTTDGLQSPISNSLISNLSLALANADISSALTPASKLAGLGAGLTPAGDDFIMGAILAAWIIHPFEIASLLAKEITEVAAALTTSLSGEWLRSAGRGEAGVLWHQFFEALLIGDPFSVQLQINKLLSIGHTSGEDALAGFLGVFKFWAGVFNGDLRSTVTL